jgi:hypothetical protein
MLCLLTTILLFGCAPNVAITPNITLVQIKDFSVSGKIDYDGNFEYLPRTVSIESHAPPLLTLRYRYDVSYGRDSVPQVLPLFNPLTLVGFPIGADTVVVTAKLEILKGSSLIKTYSSVCMLDKHRTIFSEGETMSELRKRGLLAVRNNIESQMCVDKDLLIKAGTQN